LEKFYSKFLGGEREQKNSKFEANSFKMFKHKNPFLIVLTVEIRILKLIFKKSNVKEQRFRVLNQFQTLYVSRKHHIVLKRLDEIQIG